LDFLGLVPKEAEQVGHLASRIADQIKQLNARLKEVKPPLSTSPDFTTLVNDFNTTWSNFVATMAPYVPSTGWQAVSDIVTGKGLLKSIQAVQMAPVIYAHLRVHEAEVLALRERYNKLVKPKAPLSTKKFTVPSKWTWFDYLFWGSIVVGGAYVVGKTAPAVIEAFQKKRG
jgi:hypothetical protein